MSPPVPTAVEAKSLSSINFLASNPPQYPNNPTQKGHESLTLYISRVPGTRDVILSTLRPKRKNVSGEDVANSLYYIHLDHPDDPLLLPPKPVRDEATPRSSGESQRSNAPIKRKPLPANARVAMNTTSTSTFSSTVHGVPDLPSGPGLPNTHPTPLLNAVPRRAKDDSVTVQKEVRFLDVPTEIPQTSISAPSSPQATKAFPMRPHPQGPRPPSSPHPNSSSTPPPYSPSFDNIISSPPSSSRPPLPPRPQAPIPSLPPRPDAVILATGPQSFSLSLIRRDPTTGNQWNVGKVTSITGEPVEETRSKHGHSQDRPSPMGQPINIKLETSGYAKFRGMPSRASVESTHRLSASSLSLPQPPARQAGTSTMQPSPSPGLAGPNPRTGGFGHPAATEDRAEPEGGFHRQVLMTYTKGIRAGLKEKFQAHKRHHQHRKTKRQHHHSRNDSTLSISSTSSGSSSNSSMTPSSPPSTRVLTHPSPGYRASGYAFLTPWSSRCEFRTGNGGRSLKLRHVVVLPSTTSTTATATATATASTSTSTLPYPYPSFPTSSASSLSTSTNLPIPVPSAASAAAAGGGVGGRGGGGGGEGMGLGNKIYPNSSISTSPPHPLEESGGGVTPAIFGGPGAVPVSELRFNIPSADLFAPGSKRGKIARDAQDKFNKYIRKQGGGGSNSSNSGGSGDEWGDNNSSGDDGDDNDGTMQNIGGEDAGGGNKGKRVKMGKLIVHDEGIKMLDLVVAANVGVWWSSWERTS